MALFDDGFEITIFKSKGKRWHWNVSRRIRGERTKRGSQYLRGYKRQVLDETFEVYGDVGSLETAALKVKRACEDYKSWRSTGVEQYWEDKYDCVNRLAA